MEAILWYEKSLTIFQATGRRNLEAFNLHQHLCEDLGLHELGNVEKTKGINKGRAEERHRGEGGNYNVHHPIRAHDLQDCTVIALTFGFVPRRQNVLP
jgi:hypothetical protein